MKSYSLSIPFVPMAFLVLFCSGCNMTKETGQPTPPDYQFPVDGQEIKPEYSAYWITWDERYRDIWVGGDLTGLNLDQYKFVWWTTPGDGTTRGVQSTSTSAGQDYLYFKKFTLDADDLFRPLPGEETEAIYTVHVGTSSSTKSKPINIHHVNSRVMNFELHSQLGFDFTTDYPTWKDDVKVPFENARTILNYESQTFSHPEEVIDVKIDTPNPFSTLQTYAFDKASSDWRHPGPPLNEYKLSHALIYSITNIYEFDDNGETHTLEDLRGITFTFVPQKDPFATFVILGRLRLEYSGDQLKQQIRRVVTHEFGHQRGLTGHTDGNPPLPDGHRGNGANICVMHTPGEPGYQTVDPAVFCVGHQQQLMNRRWYKEDLYSLTQIGAHQ